LKKLQKYLIDTKVFTFVLDCFIFHIGVNSCPLNFAFWLQVKLTPSANECPKSSAVMAFERAFLRIMLYAKLVSSYS